MKNDPDLRADLQRADLRLPDGIGLVYASQLQHWLTHQPALSERITGREITQHLLDKAQIEEDLTVMVIGGRGYDQLATKLPFIWTPGYESANRPLPEEEAQVVSLIQQHRPDIVLVAFGAPFQEKWLFSHQEILEESKVKIAMTVGGAIDSYLGVTPQVPTPIEKLHLEWLFRLVTQPWRWRRQLRLLVFLKLVWTEIVWSNLTTK
jgi:N-acetylglucosaminyldiphosphoundecaprenol N-acetyl-beta-D-mannosaminyltransferase